MKTLKFLWKYLCITVGCFLYAFGFVSFVKASGITSSGVTGLVNVINMIHPIDIGLWIMIINIPLLCLSLIKLKWEFTLNTLFGTALSSFFISFLEPYIAPYLPLTHNPLIACTVGGAIIGYGLGLIMKSGSSTGGADIIVKILHRKWRYLSGGTLHLSVNIIVLTFFLIVSKSLDATIYALLTILVSNTVYDLVLYGKNTSKTVYIITDKTHDIRKQLLEKCECGATILDAHGAYTNNNKQIVLCVVRNTLFPTLKDIVNEVDPAAFVIVSQSEEIYGRGYKTYKDVL